MNLKYSELSNENSQVIRGPVLLKPKIFGDDRGFFLETFQLDRYKKNTSINQTFVQDNHSKSEFNVLRGLHYQSKPFEQGKLVRVVKGEIFDVVVDLRKKEKTFGKFICVNFFFCD